MKKLITILVIMMVLVGAVFADSKLNELKVTMTVKDAEPSFKLYGSKSNGTSSTGMTAGADVTEAKTSTNAVALDDDAILAAGGATVYCVIRQEARTDNKDVRSTKTYYFTIEATELSDGNTTATSGHKTALPTVSAITKNGSADVSGARTVTGAAAGSANTGTSPTGTGRAKVVYSGKKCSAADLASFSVNWPQTDLVPGTGYEAYITMTVATE